MFKLQEALCPADTGDQTVSVYHIVKGPVTVQTLPSIVPVPHHPLYRIKTCGFTMEIDPTNPME